MTRNLPFLDLVRFLAALAVLAGHTRGLYFVGIGQVDQPGALTRAFYLLTGLHHEAVVIFFVVSGFLVGGAVWQAFAQERFRASEYLLSRFARIYIVLLPSLAIVAALQLIGSELLSGTRLIDERPLFPSGVNSGLTWRQIPCHLLGLPGVACPAWGANPPLWSLGYEWALYMIAPVVFAILYASAPLFLRLVGLASLFALLAYLIPGQEWIAWFVFWGLGAVSARLLTGGGVPVPIGLCGLALCGFAAVLSRTGFLLLWMTDVWIAVGLALALASGPILRFSPAGRLFKAGANFSFSLYVLHLPVAVGVGAMIERAWFPSTLQQPGPSSYAAFLLTVFTCLSVSFLFSRLTEANTGAFKQWLQQLARRRQIFTHGSVG